MVALLLWCYLTNFLGGQVCFVAGVNTHCLVLVGLVSPLWLNGLLSGLFFLGSYNRSPSKLPGVPLFNVAIMPSVGLPCGIVAYLHSPSWKHLRFATALVWQCFNHGLTLW